MPEKTVGELRAQMTAESRKRSLPRALTLFLGAAGLYLAIIAAIVIAPGWPFRLLLSLTAAFMVGILFVIGHDACHGAFTNRPWLNAVLGRLAFLPSWHPYSGWEHAHNRVHHAWTNLSGRDYAWAPLDKDVYDRLSSFGRFRARLYRSVLGFGLYYFLDVYVKRTLWPSRAFRGKTNMARLAADDCLVFTFIVVQACALAAGARWYGSGGVMEVLFFGQLLPWMLFNWQIGFLIFLHHTHPQVPWFDDEREWSFYAGQIRGTAHVVFPGPINWLIHGIMEHTAHHADPRVPLYRLGAAQRALELAIPDDIVIHAFTWHSFRYTLKVCKLYDYRNHRWLSFAGEPTSSPHVFSPALAPEPKEDAELLA